MINYGYYMIMLRHKACSGIKLAHWTISEISTENVTLCYYNDCYCRFFS